MKTKNKFKNYLKLGIFLFSISFILTNCKKNEDLYNLENQNVIIKKVEFEEIKKNKLLKLSLDKIEKHLVFKSNTEKHGNLKINSVDNSFSILTDEVLQVNTDSTEAFTFKIENATHSNSLFENFIIEKRNDDDYLFYIYRYKIQEDVEFQNLEDLIVSRELVNANQINLNDFSDFLNKLVYYDEETDCMVSVTYTDCCEFLDLFDCGLSSYGGSGGDYSGSENSNGNGNSNTNNPHGIGNSSSTVGIISCKNCIKEPNPCDQLKETTTDLVFKAKLQDLKNNVNQASATNMNFETAYTQTPANINMTSFNYEYFEGVANGETVALTFPTTNGLISGFMHTHYSLNHYSVFSLDDIKEIYDMAVNGHIYDDTFTAVVITKHGTTYALKFDNPQSLVDFGNQWFDQYWDINPDIVPNWLDNKSGKIRKKFNKKIQPKYSNDHNEKELAKFLDKMNVGMSLYKSNSNFTQWSKVEKNGNLTP